MGLQYEDMLDHVKMTNHDFGKYKWTDIALSLQRYYAMPELMVKEKVKFKSGDQIQFNVRTNTSGQARNVGLHSVDSVGRSDHMQHGLIPWRHSEVNWSLDERQLPSNSEPARIVDIVEEGRTDAMMDLAVLMENNFWSKPVSSDDEDMPFGLMYWVIKNITGTSASGAIPGGFNGGDPSGFSSGAANLATATYANWKNWTFKWVSVSQTDLMRRWRKASHFTDFENPVALPTYNRGNRHGYYVPYEVYSPVVESLETQNDNLGNDIASKEGQALFRGVKINWVPTLDDDTDVPVYGINWGTFYPVFMQDRYMKEKGPMMAPSQHNTIVTWIDCTYNFCCKNRRLNFVGSKAADNTEL